MDDINAIPHANAHGQTDIATFTVDKTSCHQRNTHRELTPFPHMCQQNRFPRKAQNLGSITHPPQYPHPYANDPFNVVFRMVGESDGAGPLTVHAAHDGENLTLTDDEDEYVTEWYVMLVWMV